MTINLKKLASLGFLLFVGLWIAGFCRTFTLDASDLPRNNSGIGLGSDSYASGNRMAHNQPQIELGKTPLPKVLDQEVINEITVFEKTAHLSAGTTTFADDEERIRAAIVTNKAIVFSEKATGLAPGRRLAIGVSVHPEKFDALLKALKSIGRLEAVDVQQQDRTAEFRKLHGQRLSLKKQLDAIVKLRDGSKLSVEDALKMEQRIGELEKELQTLGVQLGDFLSREPSYNLFITLQEGERGGRHDSEFTLTRRLNSGFVWAIGWWMVSVIGVSFFVGTVVSVRTLVFASCV